ncbi:lipocalin family protein [Derxia lacustris]|uniref:lipocalin family protein n=1 Tax=Derxia lacustris TaxID=764842 RepID=UPI000A171964|nr:lipocalin family protein [Derxia lacustris]
MNRIAPRRAALALLAALPLLAACSTGAPRPPLPLAARVDLPRFMGDWHVIAHIPTFLDRDAWQQVERYELKPDGSVATTFSYRKGGFDGEPKTMRPTGFPDAASGNAVWGMQFLWPIKADYRIAWLADDYSRVIVARERRDLVWIMARTPVVTDEEYAALVARVVAMGYSADALFRVPQR